MKAILILPSEILRSGRILTLFRFGVVGAVTALLYAFILIVSVEVAGLPPAAGAAISYVLAIGSNYMMHSAWTYRTGQPHQATAPRYLVTVIGLLCINVATTSILPGLLDVSYGVVQCALLFLTTIATFLMMGRWVFAQNGPALTNK